MDTPSSLLFAADALPAQVSWQGRTCTVSPNGIRPGYVALNCGEPGVTRNIPAELLADPAQMEFVLNGGDRP